MHSLRKRQKHHLNMLRDAKNGFGTTFLIYFVLNAIFHVPKNLKPICSLKTKPEREKYTDSFSRTHTTKQCITDAYVQKQR